MKRLLVLALLVVPVVSFAEEGVGRYQFVSSTGVLNFVLDTKTGKIWQVQQSKELVLTPIAYASPDHFTYSFSPTGPYNMRSNVKTTESLPPENK